MASEYQVPGLRKITIQPLNNCKMKRIFMLLMSAVCSVSAIAQYASTSGAVKAPSPRWTIDVNLLGGLANQTFTTANTIANYPNSINSNIGTLKYSKGYSFGADAELGFFFGQKRHFGLGTGVMFMEQHGVAKLTDFRLDYRAVDGSGNIFRHVLTGNDVREDVVSSMVNIPVVLKYKDRFSKHWGFAASAGALINVQMKNSILPMLPLTTVPSTNSCRMQMVELCPCTTMPRSHQQEIGW